MSVAQRVRHRAPKQAADVVAQALARWSQRDPSPEDIVSAHVDRLHEHGSPEWWEAWHRYLTWVVDARVIGHG